MIEFSLPGISISAQSVFFDSLIPDSTVQVAIDCFEYDSTAKVHIGHLAYLTPSLLLRLPDTMQATTVEAVAYENQLKMLYDFQAGRLEAVITDYAPRLDGVRSRTLATVAPWVITLAPNPASRLAQDGILTTSLFYRFDPASLALITDGDSARPWYGFSADSGKSRRVYPFNPDTGRKLLRNLAAQQKHLTFQIENKSQARPAGYFADILSRDRLSTQISEDSQGPDLQLLTVPLECGDDTLALQWLLARLASDTVAGFSINETIAQAAFHVAAAGRQPDSSLRAASLQRASSKLIEDAGVFPLYRPGLFLTHRSTVIDIGVTPVGKFDLSAVQVLIPPPYLREQ
jgi:hypothetical protein